MRQRDRYAFSLIELLVVISIIAVLMAITFPALRKTRIISQKLVCASNLRQVHLGFELYMADNDDVYPCADDPVSQKPFYWLWMGRGWRGFISDYLGGGINAENPSVLLCPVDRDSEIAFEGTSYSYSMAFYHSVKQIDSMTSIADSYSNPLASVRQRSTNVSEPGRKALAGEWYSNHEKIDSDIGWWDSSGSRNFLFADGSVVFLETDKIYPANDGNPNPCLTIRGIKGETTETSGFGKTGKNSLNLFPILLTLDKSRFKLKFRIG